MVSQLCKNKMIVTFNNKVVLVNNSDGEIVIRGHLDLGNNLYMVSTDDTIHSMKHPRNEISLK